MRLSQVIINFFEFLIQRNKENTLIYVKVLREISKIIGSSYDIVAESYDEKWGEFCIGIKNIEYEK